MVQNYLYGRATVKRSTPRLGQGPAAGPCQDQQLLPRAQRILEMGNQAICLITARKERVGRYGLPLLSRQMGYGDLRVVVCFSLRKYREYHLR